MGCGSCRVVELDGAARKVKIRSHRAEICPDYRTAKSQFAAHYIDHGLARGTVAELDLTPSTSQDGGSLLNLEQRFAVVSDNRRGRPPCACRDKRRRGAIQNDRRSGVPADGVRSRVTSHCKTTGCDR